MANCQILHLAVKSGAKSFIAADFLVTILAHSCIVGPASGTNAGKNPTALPTTIGLVAM